VVNSRSGSFDSYVAFGSSDSSPSASNAGNTGDIGIKGDGGIGGREIDRKETLLPPDEHQSAVETIRTAWPDAEIIGQWLTADELFPGSGQCKDCGDPLNGPGLMQRCRGRHQVMPA
jgi:hypothetical protein